MEIWRLFFFLLIQYFIVQLIVVSRISGYSVINDYISALGDQTKSPLFSLMNFSFFLNGLLIILGSLSSNKDIASKALLSVSAIGAILVALNPENKNADLHITGASLSFIFGNLGLLSLGLHAQNSKQRVLCLGGAAIGFLSLPIYLINQQNKGLWERLVSYPLPIALFGLSLIQ